MGVANSWRTARAATGLAARVGVLRVVDGVTVGDVVALTATGESCAGGVTRIISTPSATRPIEPVAIAKPRVDRCANVR